MSAKNTTNQTRQIETFFETRANFVPSSINEEERTVEVVFATETPYRRMVPYSLWDEIDADYYDEVLVCTPDAVDLSRLNANAPLLNTHSRSTLTDQIGKVEPGTIKIQNGQTLATVRFSKRKGVDDIWNDVKDGIYTNISVGYDVKELTISAHVVGEVPQGRATKWMPGEISLVPLPADFNAGVRSVGLKSGLTRDDSKEKLHEVTILKTDMKPGENQPEGSEVRTTEAPAPAAPATPAATPVNETEIRASADKAAQVRILGIQNVVRLAGLPDTLATKLVSEGVTLEAARAKVFEELERNQVTINSNNTSVGNEAEVRATRVKGLQAAVGIKIIGFTPELRATAGEFYGLTIHELARECAELSGVNTRGMSRPQVAKIALNQERGFGMHTTSDFPNILGINFRTKLRKDYDLQPRTFLAWSSRTTLPDFRENRSAQIGGISTFEEVLQGGEYKRKTMEEAVEAYRLKKYGAIVGVSWELLINDDLGAFNKTAKNFANAAAQTQSDLMYEVLTGNPLMGDGFALFSTQHKNLAATGTVIDDVNIGKAREAMRKQVSLEKSVLNIVPRFLIVGPTQEQNALRYTNPNFVPVNANNINIYASSLVVIVDARITDNAWYLAADPASIDTVEFAFLEGEEELFTEERAAFDQDAYEYKARMVFGRKALDYRGLYKNPGALPA